MEAIGAGVDRARIVRREQDRRVPLTAEADRRIRTGHDVRRLSAATATATTAATTTAATTTTTSLSSTELARSGVARTNAHARAIAEIEPAHVALLRLAVHHRPIGRIDLAVEAVT